MDTTIINGKIVMQNKQFLDLDEAVAMRDAIPDAELVVIPNAGHLPTVEQPLKVNEALRSFLERLP